MPDKQNKVDIMINERPYVAQIIQTQLLNDIAGILYEQLATMKDSIPDLVRKYTFSVTDQVLELNEDNVPTLPWISMVLYNDGGSPVFIYVNEMDSQYTKLPGVVSETPLAVNDSFAIDFRSSKIKKLYLVCDNGGTSSIRIFASCKYYRAEKRVAIDL